MRYKVPSPPDPDCHSGVSLFTEMLQFFYMSFTLYIPISVKLIRPVCEINNSNELKSIR
jgi:hypothetical protein